MIKMMRSAASPICRMDDVPAPPDAPGLLKFTVGDPPVNSVFAVDPDSAVDWASRWSQPPDPPPNNDPSVPAIILFVMPPPDHDEHDGSNYPVEIVTGKNLVQDGPAIR